MNEYTAKNGFKTFVLTLGISLLFFGLVYFLLNANTGVTENIDDAKMKTTNEEVLGTTTEAPKEQATEEVKVEEKPTVFAEIAKSKPSVVAPAVLAGATQSTQSTVPVTGTTSITLGFMTAVSLLAFSAYTMVKGPRKAALKSFERDVTSL